MRYPKVIGLALLAAGLMAGCGEERILGPDSTQTTSIQPDAIARDLVAAFAWPVDAEAEIPEYLQSTDKGRPPLISFEREVLTGDIAHYYAVVATGPGEYDRIRLLRVVRERSPGVPIKTRKAVMFHNADNVAFINMVLSGTVEASLPDDYGIGIYLAQNDVDVWGVDQSWILVPEDETSFEFMWDWGVAWAAENLRLAVQTARLVRLRTGNGFRKMNICGPSTGAAACWALLDAETQSPPGHRSVGGFIQLGWVHKTDDEVIRTAFCSSTSPPTSPADFNTMHDFGYAALNFPDDPSPMPGMTNREFFLQVVAVPGFYGPVFHFWAGVFDENGVPVDLQYSLFESAAEYCEGVEFHWIPTTWWYDYSVCVCDVEDVPYDDHLSAIDVPVLNVAAAGGWGAAEFYTSSLTASRDVTSLLVRLRPEGEEALDFGWADQLTAPEAPALVFQPVAEWLEAHTH